MPFEHTSVDASPVDAAPMDDLIPAGARSPTGRAVKRPCPHDATLIAMVRAKHPNAAAMLFDRYETHVARILTRLLGADPEIEDLVHETFIDAFVKIDQLRDPSRVKAWLSCIAVFKARGLLRRRKRWRFIQYRAPESVPDFPASEASAEKKALLHEALRVVAGLPVNERLCFSLRHFVEMTLPEVADATGLSLATVKRKIKRAEVYVRKILEEHDS